MRLLKERLMIYMMKWMNMNKQRSMMLNSYLPKLLFKLWKIMNLKISKGMTSMPHLRNMMRVLLLPHLTLLNVMMPTIFLNRQRCKQIVDLQDMEILVDQIRCKVEMPLLNEMILQTILNLQMYEVTLSP